VRIVCASANPHKAAEIADLMHGIAELVPRPVNLADIDEYEDTLVGNARLKAAAVCAATGLPAVADDTGLEIDALGGAPGVRTARWGGEPPDDALNRARALRELAGARSRTGRFRTVALVRFPDGRELVAEGTCEGTIAEAERGSRGFGYDPLFIPAEGDGRTFAEMTIEEKHRLSHRGRAFRSLALLLSPPA
jgi:XTP/dITP diphosphohydrolase